MRKGAVCFIYSQISTGQLDKFLKFGAKSCLFSSYVWAQNKQTCRGNLFIEFFRNYGVKFLVLFVCAFVSLVCYCVIVFFSLETIELGISLISHRILLSINHLIKFNSLGFICFFCNLFAF